VKPLHAKTPSAQESVCRSGVRPRLLAHPLYLFVLAALFDGK